MAPLPPRSVPTRQAWRGLMAAIACAYAVLAVAHALTTPVLSSGSLINAPDEPAHLAYVRALAVGHRLPQRGDREFPTYQWHQPPLYYALAASVYPLGPVAVRLLGIVFGLLTLVAIWCGARGLFPGDPGLAALAAGAAALVPMRQAVTSSVGNDALTELLFAASLAVMLRIVLVGLTTRRSIALGALLGAALLTKASGFLLLPMAAAALWLATREGTSRSRAAVGAAQAALVVLALAGPWYARNLRVYGELTPVRSFAAEFAGTQKASDWIGKAPLRVDLWSGSLVPGPTMTRTGYEALVANWSWRTFWAAYTPLRKATIGAPDFLPPPYYLLCALIALSAAAGWLVRRPAIEPAFATSQRRASALLAGVALLVLTSFAAFAWTYFQAQGRYLYPAMLPLALLGAAGLRRAAGPARRDAVSLAVLGLLLVLSALFYAAAILPAYA